MTEARNRERINASELQDFLFKVYQCNGEPDFLQARILDISEEGVSGFTLDESMDIQVGDTISGVIEGEDFGVKIRYEAKVNWIQADKKGNRFGVGFTHEIVLPSVLIARLMAVV